MTDAAEGGADAIRGVVVLTDGLANHGSTRLDDLVRTMSRDEVAIREFSGFHINAPARDVHGRDVARADVVGTGLALATRHPVQVFFIGIGNDADVEIGRVLAEATGVEFQGVTEADLANVLAEFGKYFSAPEYNTRGPREEVDRTQTIIDPLTGVSNRRRTKP